MSIFDNLSFHHPASTLLVLVPALLNLGLAGYIRYRLPRNLMSQTLGWLTLTIFLWQMDKVFASLAETAHTAALWQSLLSVGWVFMLPLLPTFALIFSRNVKLYRSPLFIILLYGPAITMAIYAHHLVDYASYINDEFWGYLPYMEFEGEKWYGAYSGLMGFLSLGILITYAIRVWKHPQRGPQARIIAGGLMVPLVAGIVFEAVLPIFNPDWIFPISSTLFTFFTISAVVALHKFGFLSVSDIVESKSVFDVMPDVVMVVDKQQNITYLNPVGMRYLGVNESRLGELKLADVLVSQNPEGAFSPANVQNLLNELDDDAPGQYYLQANDKLRIPVTLSSNPIGNTAQNRMLLIVARDISALLQARMALQEQNEELLHASREIDTIFRSTSHDIRAPLHSILGITRLAKMETEDPQQQEYLDLIENRIEKLESFTREMMHLSKNLRNQKSEPIDLNILLKEICDPLQLHRDGKQIDLQLDIRQEVPFCTEPYRLRTIFHNLISNAIAYHDWDKAKPYIKVAVEVSKKELVASVSDNGEGIGQQQQTQIFDMFYRASSRSSGFGMGLYLVKESVAKLRGQIRLESVKGEGTTFHIVIPNCSGNDEEATVREGGESTASRWVRPQHVMDANPS